MNTVLERGKCGLHRVETLIKLQDLKYQVLAEALHSEDLCVLHVALLVDLTRSFQHDVRLVGLVEVICLVQFRSGRLINLALEDLRLHILRKSTSNALALHVAKQVVVSSLLYVLLVDGSNILKSFKETCDGLIEGVGGWPELQDAGLLQEVELSDEGVGGDQLVWQRDRKSVNGIQ